MFDKQKLTDGCVIRVPAGVHYLPEPIKLRGKNIRFIGEDGAVLRATLRLRQEDFEDLGGGVYSAPVSRAADALYIGTHKYTMARYPKYQDDNRVFGGYAADCILPEKTKDWRDPAGGYLHAMHKHLWGGYSYRIAGKNEDGTLALTGGWQNNRKMGMHDAYRFVENIREEMTAPGEWYFDEKAMRVYVRPLTGDSLADVEIAVSHSFFVLEDCEQVSLENLTMERSARTFMQTKEPLLRSDWTIFRGGAVLVRNSKNCMLDRCVFRDIGSNGVFVDGNCQEITLRRSHITHIGASGVCFVGRPDAVRSPLFAYEQELTPEQLDKTPGPKSDNYPKNCTVSDCLIEHVGTTEKQAAGVQISMAYGITVENTTVCHVPRAGINISEGTFGGHRIEGCDVFDTVRETGDHGSFNSWGRDRYWHVPGLEAAQIRQYALLDLLAPNVITRSRFRCDRGWDIDLDDGSSCYEITQNLCLNGGIKLREGFFRTVRGNITVNNTVHLHVWYPNSGDVVENNLLFQPYAPIRMPAVWGESVDGNYLHMPGLEEAQPAGALQLLSGQDHRSVCLDALMSVEGAVFVPTNAALEGFEDFPRVFGVRYEPLRALADVPICPKIAVAGKDGGGNMPRVIHGMLVKDIETDGEMSVYGTAGHTGVLVLKVNADSAAAQRGLREGDVIIRAGSRDILHSPDLEAADLTDVLITVLRIQKKLHL